MTSLKNQDPPITQINNHTLSPPAIQSARVSDEKIGDRLGGSQVCKTMPKRSGNRIAEILLGLVFIFAGSANGFCLEAKSDHSRPIK
jgi:hypothetical protein